MDHLQIPIEVNDASWRERCKERMKRLKNTQFPASQPTGFLQEQLSMEKRLMTFELCTCVQNKKPDKFVDELANICDKRNLSLTNILDQVTHRGDSLLHVAADFGAEDIGELIACHFPELLTRRNIKGDTPLHVAARAKNLNVVRMILSQYDAVNSLENEDNKLTRLKNEHGNTALQEAVHANHFDTVFHLFEADKQVAHHLNKSGKSALYIAVLNSDKNILDLLLQAPFVDKPFPKCHGISPLHAAISKENSSLLADILKKNKELIYLRDEYGGTLLHYAVSTCYLDGIRILLEKCSVLALQCNKKGHLPIHIACKRGQVRVVKQLLEQGPNVRDSLNQKGQNILHIAAKSGKDKVVKYLLEEATLEKFIINEKDRNGNTALHLASQQIYPNVLIHLVQDERVDLNIKNNDDLTAYDLVLLHTTTPTSSHREMLADRILLCASSEQSEKTRNICRQNQPQMQLLYNLTQAVMLIAILIATVTFAAGFTVPGGVYSSDDPNPKRRGIAVLANKAGFQMFVVCNTIAMFGSTIGCIILMRVWIFGNRNQMALKFYVFGVFTVSIALWAMFLAFVAATRLLASNVSWIAISMFILTFVLFHLEEFFLYFPKIASNIPRLRRLWYFMFERIYMPIYGGFDVKITKKHEDTDSKRVNMDKDKEKEKEEY